MAEPTETRSRGPLPLLDVRSVTKRYGGVQALVDVNLQVEKGEIYGIIGPNGAGKSTLVDVLTGFTPPTSGSTWLGNAELTGVSPHRVAALGVARTFQHTSIFEAITVAENLMVAAVAHRPSHFVDAFIGRRRHRRERSEIDRAIEAVLHQTDLEGFGDVDAATLSYGAQRRLEVALALMVDPRVLLLDEPAAGMNPVESARFVELVRQIARGRTIVLVEHDMSVVRALCGRLTVLVDGSVVIDGDTSTVLADPVVAEVYLGVAT